MSYPPPPPTGPDDSGSTPPPPPPPPYGSQPPMYGGQPPGYPPGGAYAGGYGAAPAANQKALWAMILGIIGLVCCGFAAIGALVLGVQAKKEIEASGGMQTGAGQAQAGFILGIIGCALWALGLVLYAGLAVVGMSTS